MITVNGIDGESFKTTSSLDSRMKDAAVLTRAPALNDKTPVGPLWNSDDCSELQITLHPLSEISVTENVIPFTIKCGRPSNGYRNR